jgi:hypothetical protein
VGSRPPSSSTGHHAALCRRNDRRPERDFGRQRQREVRPPLCGNHMEDEDEFVQASTK